jgi:two-component system, response regulator
MESIPCDILIVEDNPNDSEMMLRALRKANLANPVTVVEDGATALDYLFGLGAYAGLPPNRTPRVVLLDLKLPKLTGLEVLARIRADERTRLLPVVMVTSSREDPDIKEAYRLGANSYVVKPTEFEQFVDAMAKIGLYWVLYNEPPR